jgi:hypothetical protein
MTGEGFGAHRTSRQKQVQNSQLFLLNVKNNEVDFIPLVSTMFLSLFP